MSIGALTVVNSGTVSVSGTTFTITGNTVAAKTKIWLLIGFGAAGKTVSSVTADDGNTYTVDKTQANGGAAVAIVSCPNPGGLAAGNTITVTLSATTGATAVYALCSDTGATATVDKTAATTGTSTSPSSGNTATLSNSSELVIGAVAAGGSATWTPGSGYTTLLSLGARVAFEYKIVAATTALPADGTLGTSRAWAAAVATYAATATPTNTVAPAVTGTPNVGSLQTCSTGTWTTSGSVSYAYVWQRDNLGDSNFATISPGGSITSTYTLITADDGCNIRCVVTATDDNGSTPCNSNAISAVEPTPATSSAQAVTGTANVGYTLTVTATGWTNMDGHTPTFTYQWRDCATSGGTYADISGQTATTYVVGAGETTKYLKCVVTAHNTGGTATHDSTILGPVTANTPTNTVAPISRTGHPRFNIQTRVLWDATCVFNGALYAVTSGGHDGISNEYIFKWADPTLPAYTQGLLVNSAVFELAICSDPVNNCLYVGPQNRQAAGPTHHATIYKVDPSTLAATTLVNDVLLPGATDAALSNGGAVATDGTYIYLVVGFTVQNTIVYRFLCSDGSYVSSYAIPNISSYVPSGICELVIDSGNLYVAGNVTATTPSWIARIPLSGFNTSTQITVDIDIIDDDIIAAFGYIWLPDELQNSHPNGRLARVAADLSSVSYYDTGFASRGIDGITNDGSSVWFGISDGVGIIRQLDPTALTVQGDYTLRSGETDVNEVYLVSGGLSVITAYDHPADAKPTQVIYQPLPITPPATGNVNDVFTVDVGAWTDDGSPTITYQWQRDNSGGGSYSNIGSATSNTHTAVIADAGCKIRCNVTDTDSNGGTTQASNTVTINVPSNPTNTVAPAASGTATVGQVVTTDHGTWVNAGTPAYTYQWQRDSAGNLTFSNIGSATSASYTLVDADDACHVRCVITNSDSGGGSATANSNNLGLVVESVPVNSVAPAVTGTATVGQTLTSSTGTWSHQGGTVHTFAYQWQRDAQGSGGYTNIAAATASTYVLVGADDLCHIRCFVTATNTGGNGTATASNVVGTVVDSGVPVNSVAPAGSGTLNVNSFVSVTTGTWSHTGGNAVTYTYQWQDSANGTSGWANIAAATSSGYSIAIGELNLYLRCNVTAHNSAGDAASATPSQNSFGPVGAALAATSGRRLLLGVG